MFTNYENNYVMKTNRHMHMHIYAFQNYLYHRVITYRGITSCHLCWFWRKASGQCFRRGHVIPATTEPLSYTILLGEELGENFSAKTCGFRPLLTLDWRHMVPPARGIFHWPDLFLNQALLDFWVQSCRCFFSFFATFDHFTKWYEVIRYIINDFENRQLTDKYNIDSITIT